MKVISLLAISLFIVSCSQTSEKKVAKLPSSIKEAVRSDFRSVDNVKRDQYRHPQETLEFFGLKPNMTVIEITPGAGWYTEILAPLLVQNGRYIMATPALKKDAPAYQIANSEKLNAMLARHPQVLAKTESVDFNPANNPKIVEDGTADMVLTFRNVHNWLGNNTAQAAFKSFYRALKPGGVLGVVEHRAPANRKFDLKSGYMTEAQVIDLAKKAGFKLQAKSEVNANPKDSANHPSGVWTLPPSLRLGDKDRAKYEAIGESDRMTLKFVK